MDWPIDLIPYEWQFYLQPNSRVFRSPVTRARQVLIGQGPMWVGTAQFRFTSRRLEQRLEALLDKMKGQAETVNVWDFGAKYGLPLGPALDVSTLSITAFNTAGSPGGVTYFTTSGSPGGLVGFTGGAGGVTVYGGRSVGDEAVIVRGFLQNTTALYAGDNVQIGDFLYRLTEDAEVNGFNRATLYLNRPLLQDVEHGDIVVLVRPRTPMQLLDDDQSRRRVGVDHVREYTVSFVEALNA